MRLVGFLAHILSLFCTQRLVTGIVAQEEIESPPPSIWEKPEGESKVHTWFWYFSWPIRFVLTCTIPNPRTYRNLYWLTFIVCVVYIGLITYFIFWMMVVIGMSYVFFGDNRQHFFMYHFHRSYI